MKWIKGFLIFGMVMLAHSTVSINDAEAGKPKTEQAGKKGKAAKGKSAAPKKGGLFSSFTAGLKKARSKVAAGAKAAGSKIKAGAKAAGSKISAGAKAVKDKAGSAVECRSGKGEVPGQNYTLWQLLEPS